MYSLTCLLLAAIANEMIRGLSTEMDGFYNWENPILLIFKTWTHCQLILKPLH